MPKTIAESAAFIRASIDQLHRPLADDASEYEARILTAERSDVREARVVIEDLARHARWSNDETLRLALLEQLPSEHRYIQNQLIITLLTALGDLGALYLDRPAMYSDARNDFAMKLCAKLRECFRDELFWR